ncbi:MAG: hypothetical protein L3K24_03220 [Gammaproteobacteria bacterium]|nr:hypothetical protein [Gammaproteobacteria bacterium]
MKAVIFGTGRAAGGFVAPMLHAAGYEIVFVARGLRLRDHLNRTGRIEIQLVDGPTREQVIVKGVRAIEMTDQAALSREIVSADLIASCVGPSNLKSLGIVIASGLTHRRAPVNLIAFENCEGAGSILRRAVAAADGPVDSHGFASGLIHRVICRRRWYQDSDTPIRYTADPESKCEIEAAGLRVPMPTIAGMTLVQDHTAAARRKFFTYSAAHAAVAYLGHLKGYYSIHAALQDLEIRGIVKKVLKEGQRGLDFCYGAGFSGGKAERQRICKRLSNGALRDTIARVGREPLRKLGGQERLIGAASLALLANSKAKALSWVTAAALCYFDPEDASSRQLHALIENRGAQYVLQTISAVDLDQDFVSRTIRHVKQLSTWSRSSHLITIKPALWASRPMPAAAIAG